MPRKNKILHSEWKKYVEAELKRGITYRDLATDLKGKGFEISHTAIADYHAKYLLKDRSEETAPTQIEHESLVESIEFNENIDVLETIKRSYKRQSQIFEHKQSQFMKGVAKFPSRELSALKDLQAILKAHHTGITDMNEGIEKVSRGSYEDLLNEARALASEVTEARALALLRYFVIEASENPPEKLLRAIVSASKEGATDDGYGGLAFSSKVNIAFNTLNIPFYKKSEVEELARDISHQRAIKEGYYNENIRQLYITMENVYRESEGRESILERFDYYVCEELDKAIKENPATLDLLLKDAVEKYCGGSWVEFLSVGKNEKLKVGGIAKVSKGE